ncbi:cytochrome b-245 chaperone 1-like [Lytechinus variegatus]|uniref:cytochrome b-245 chaperone 1-like n=1 Tax=Lytechinus variegatus TaxID=7654 RepID=UPI001BB28931|nr:cytochrome b-245 chaperone 1-like [Lytechinus variegatus]
MVYMSVAARNEKMLHLARSPGFRAWSTFFGILAIGCGMVIFSNDDWLWKSFCLFCCGFVAICSLDDWEECIIEKDGDILLKRFSLIEKILRPKENQRQVIAESSSIVKAEVEAEDIRFFGKGRLVMLYFSAGYTLPLTEKCTLGDGSDHEVIAELIRKFLELEKKTWVQMEFHSPNKQPQSSSSSSSCSSSDEMGEDAETR